MSLFSLCSGDPDKPQLKKQKSREDCMVFKWSRHPDGFLVNLLGSSNFRSCLWIVPLVQCEISTLHYAFGVVKCGGTLSRTILQNLAGKALHICEATCKTGFLGITAVRFQYRLDQVAAWGLAVGPTTCQLHRGGWSRTGGGDMRDRDLQERLGM